MRSNWDLGGATAYASRRGGALHIRVAGLVTAPGYELMALRAASISCEECLIEIDAGALLCATPRSLAEAAARGLPTAAALDRRWVIVGDRCRRRWLGNHAAALIEQGVQQVRALCWRWGSQALAR